MTSTADESNTFLPCHSHARKRIVKLAPGGNSIFLVKGATLQSREINSEFNKKIILGKTITLTHTDLHQHAQSVWTVV